VSKLEEVAAKIRKLGATEPGRAVGLYETFLASCHAKADELDDSDGSFGQFAHELICLWIKARQASGAEPDKTASTLLAWMNDDPYAFCHEIEKDAAAAFDKAGLAAFEKQIRERFEAASTDPSSWPYRHVEAIARNAGSKSHLAGSAMRPICQGLDRFPKRAIPTYDVAAC
jgi:hypothetical protein